MKERDKVRHPLEENDGPMTKESLIEKLLYLRDDWLKNEGSRDYSLSDGRVLWYLTIALNLDLARNEGILPESVKNEVDDYFKWYKDPSRRDKRYPIIDKSSEIDRANELITSVLKNLGFTPEKYD